MFLLLLTGMKPQTNLSPLSIVTFFLASYVISFKYWSATDLLDKGQPGNCLALPVVDYYYYRAILVRKVLDRTHFRQSEFEPQP